MALRVQETKVDVDMVPMIDIITLVLLFLVMVGDMTKSASAVKMKLPRLDQAVSDSTSGLAMEGRITIQLKQDSRSKEYSAVVNNCKFELGHDEPYLKTYLNEQVIKRLAMSKKSADEFGRAPFPVKLRIPASAPMLEVEKIVQVCARAGLTDVHYASEMPVH